MRRLTRRQRVAALVLAALAACFITLDLGGSSLDSAHGGVRGALGSLYRGTDSVLGPVRRFAQGVPHAGTDESRIHALERQNAALQAQVSAAQLDSATVARLRALNLAADGGGWTLVDTRVLAMSPSQGFDWTVTLGAGTSRGVRAGQSVTDGNGLVGRVLHADASTSVVLLAVDPGSGVGARDTRTGEIGVVTGAGHDGYTFRPVDPAAVPKVGDRLSSGPSGASSYVAGLSLGTVRSVRVSGDGSTLVAVTPTVSPTTLDLVGVIVRGGSAGGSSSAGGS